MVGATDLKLLRALPENPDSGIAELGERIIKDDLLSLPSVGQMNSSFGLSEIKNSHVLPI